METIKQVLMRRDKMSAEEADELIREAKEEVARRIEESDGLEFWDMDAEICGEYFGLEPDYFMELMP